MGRSLRRWNPPRSHRKTLNSRLTLKHGSDQRETLQNRRSDISRHFTFRRRILGGGENFGPKNLFKSTWRGFWRAMAERTSKSASSSNQLPALDRLLLRSVRLKIVRSMSGHVLRWVRSRFAVGPPCHQFTIHVEKDNFPETLIFPKFQN